ncbi:hypothetical protein WJX84_011273 [Apatococcus fuscideae]|uniref:Uncharacterized protein n=1 Tax=Apatococcus fuscideae TaxID=2026836 RepID=A0AAW1RKZ6_9CHLO
MHAETATAAAKAVRQGADSCSLHGFEELARHSGLDAEALRIATWQLTDQLHSRMPDDGKPGQSESEAVKALELLVDDLKAQLQKALDEEAVNKGHRLRSKQLPPAPTSLPMIHHNNLLSDLQGHESDQLVMRHAHQALESSLAHFLVCLVVAVPACHGQITPHLAARNRLHA